jgi:cell division protein FtsN
MVNPDRNLYEPPYDDALLYESDLEPERPRSRPLVVLLGIVVLAAFAGVVWVAYNQGIKHGQSGAPILAADGPSRVPGDPAAPQDVAADKSYDRLFGANGEPQTETVLPEPEQPRAMAATEEPPVPQPQDSASKAAQGGPNALVATDVPPPSGDPRMDSTIGVPPAAPQPAAPVSEDITSVLPPAEAAAPPKQLAAVKPTAPKVISAAPSKPAPSALTATPSAAPKAPAPEETAITDLATPAPVPEVAPATTGSVTIQLGSFPNSALAATAWSKIKSSNQELLGSYSPTIKPAEIEGKGTWYRLRVGGFADKAAARAVCDQLAAGGQACIIASK